MSRSRRSSVRLAGAWALTLLLLVPLAFAGHHHGAEPSSHSCATCTATHAAFAPPAAPIVLAIFAVARHSISLAPADVLVQLDQDDHHGRAPPAASTRRPV